MRVAADAALPLYGSLSLEDRPRFNHVEEFLVAVSVPLLDLGDLLEQVRGVPIPFQVRFLRELFAEPALLLMPYGIRIQ